VDLGDKTFMAIDIGEVILEQGRIGGEVLLKFSNK
jgi:hypothetical protein